MGVPGNESGVKGVMVCVCVCIHCSCVLCEGVCGKLCVSIHEGIGEEGCVYSSDECLRISVNMYMS